MRRLDEDRLMPRDKRNQSGQEAPIVITPRALARLLRQIVTVVRPKSGMIKRKP